VTAGANIAKGAAIMDIRRKRLVYRANYRGFKEADLILGGFAKAYIETLTENEVTMFEELLTAKDHDIYDWITGAVPVPANYDTPLLKRLKAFKPFT
jgi:antitoxin CptB